MPSTLHLQSRNDSNQQIKRISNYCHYSLIFYVQYNWKHYKNLKIFLWDCFIVPRFDRIARDYRLPRPCLHELNFSGHFIKILKYKLGKVLQIPLKIYLLLKYILLNLFHQILYILYIVQCTHWLFLYDRNFHKMIYSIHIIV